ncbi:MAG: VWA domain-containing protein [Gemmatimonadetes bacterium]|nr:VWA domain-containing protein [Gemmatimonadota bacterium]
MSFLSPWLLALAGAAAVPLLLHLMRRRIGARLDFPAVRYLRRAEREHSRELKLRNLLLMLLRVAIVLLLALAAARPLGPGLGPGHPPTAWAIVLDNSMSTSAISEGRPVLDRLREVARRAAGEASSGDRLWLVTADARVTTGSVSQVTAAIGRAEPLAGAGDPRAALDRALALVRSSGLDARHVAVVTDGQATAWTGATDAGHVAVSVFAAEGPPPRNRAVTHAVASPAYWTPRGRVEAQLRSTDSVTWRVVLGDRTVARGTSAAGEEVGVSTVPLGRGWLAGRVEIDPDELRGDDVRWFAAWVGDAPRLRVEREAGPFADGAVEALVQGRRAERGDGIAVTPADLAGARPALVLAPRDPVRLGAANRALERAGIPWRLGEVRREGARARGLAGAGARLDGARVARRYQLVPVSGAGATDTLATVSGEAWVVAGDGYVLVGSALDTADTDLPVGAAFAPWVAAVITERLAGNTGLVLALAPGAPLAHAAGITGLERADGSVLPLVAGTTPRAPAMAGVYLLRRGAARAGAVVVNPEPGESDLTRLGTDALAARVASTAVATTSERAFRAASWAGGTRRPLMASLLLLVVLALAAEALVARRGIGTGAA